MTRIRITADHVSAAAVTVVAAIAAGISFIHIVILALAYHQDTAAAYMTPVSIDGTVVVCSLALLRAARLGLPSPFLAYVGLWSGVLATLACNLGYGISANLAQGTGHIVAGAALSGWPAYAFLICAEVAIRMVRRSARKQRAARKPADVTVAAATDTPAATVTQDGPPVFTRPERPAANGQPDGQAAGRVAAVVAALATQPNLTGEDLAAMGYVGSTRTGRRVLAEAKALAASNGHLA